MTSILKKLTSHRLFKNTSALVIMQLFTYVAPFIVLPYLSRVLGADGFGLMIAALSLTVIANVCTDFGFNLSATYLISRKQSQTHYISKVITAIYALKLGLLVFVFSGIALYLALAVSYTPLAIAAIYMTVFFQAFMSPWLFQGIEKMKLITYSTIASRMVYVVIIFLLVKHKNDYDLALMYNAIATMLACFLANWLIRKPGLFTPTKDERNMQIALTARYNSGCISRQVGACVTGKDGYILGVGWNDVPEWAILCLYRSSYSLLMENNNAPEFSEYEISGTFKNYIGNKVGANKKPFCFKDLENDRQAEESLKNLTDETKIELTDGQQKSVRKLFKNPTRERALHAEENAFLQSAKVGVASLQGGTLYTTASPCQLCAKKAMQLGIARIVYIDAYPDISTKQTLESGPQANRPIVEQFSGAAESAFMKLFKSLINIKDELKEA